MALQGAVRSAALPLGLGDGLKRRHARSYTARIAAVKPRRTCGARASLREGATSVSGNQKAAQIAAATTTVAGTALLQCGPAFAEETAVAVVSSPTWLVLLEYLVLGGGYLLVAPVLIFAYLRERWYKRNNLETLFQFGLVFFFFPGIFVLSPFLNFRPKKYDPTQVGPPTTVEKNGENDIGRWPYVSPDKQDIVM